MQTKRISWAGILLLLLAPALPRLYADTPKNYGAPVDSSAVQVRQIPDGALAPYLVDEAFLYDRDSTGPSLWDFLRLWLWEKAQDWGWGEHWSMLEKIILGTIVILGLWLLASQLFGAQLRGLFYGPPDRPVAELLEADEDIEKMDFERQIQDAVARRHYRLAIRLYYLKSLKTLADQHLIDWKRDKINQDYVLELANSPLRRPFVEITGLFERIWYGKTPLEEATFQETEAVFQRFGNQFLGKA